MVKYRFLTRTVNIGGIGIGGEHPVRIQSMTNTNTLDASATVDQAIRLAQAGCEIVRVAVPGIREALQLEKIKNQLLKKGYAIPIIADVHFNPETAMIAAAIVEKVRVNPGNFTDRNIGKSAFSEIEYQAAIARIKERFLPLIEICKKHGTALRIGSNHGSLSERIVSRYGNTPEGMVEAALEFVRICREEDFHNIVLSMKASSVRTMVYSNRLLVKQMIAENMDYPIHLGVTEAGNGAEGRLKSAIGAGTLLADGIGDTIRVSLTEDPVNEIPVAREIVSYFDHFSGQENISDKGHFLTLPHACTPVENHRRLFRFDLKTPLVLASQGEYGKQKPDLIIDEKSCKENFCWINGIDDIPDDLPKIEKPIIFQSSKKAAVHEFREFFAQMEKLGVTQPVILKKQYNENEITVGAGIDFGPLFLDGFGDGLWIDSVDKQDKEQRVELSFQLLQAAGARISQTEYIACPSCGRTLYNIEVALEEIKQHTFHLKGLKIAVMGCIVNGPGEMADADYGYVGMGAGKVALFKGKNLVKKNVPQSEAVGELICLIKANGDWQEVQLTSG